MGILEALREIGFRKGAIVIAVAAVVLIALHAWSPFNVDLSSFMPYATLALILAVTFLVVDWAEALLARRAKVAEEAAQEKNARAFQDAMMGNNAYAKLDDIERSVLRRFVDEHEQSLPRDQTFDPGNADLMFAIHRLTQRGFVVEEQKYNSYYGNRAGKFYLYLHDKHWRNLIERPDLVGSDAPPRAFG